MATATITTKKGSKLDKKVDTIVDKAIGTGLRKEAARSKAGQRLTLFPTEAQPDKFALKVAPIEVTMPEDRQVVPRGGTIYVLQKLRVDAVTQRDKRDGDYFVKNTEHVHSGTPVETWFIENERGERLVDDELGEPDTGNDS